MYRRLHSEWRNNTDLLAVTFLLCRTVLHTDRIKWLSCVFRGVCVCQKNCSTLNWNRSQSSCCWKDKIISLTLFYFCLCCTVLHRSDYDEISLRFIVTCGNDGDVRIWESLDDDDPKFITVGEKAYSLALKVGHLPPSGTFTLFHRLVMSDGFLLRHFVTNQHGSCQRLVEMSSFLHRKASWWRRAPTTQCRSTRFLMAIQMAFWPGSLPTPRMSPSTAAARESLPDPGTRDSRLTWKTLEGVSNDLIWKTAGEKPRSVQRW